MEKPTKPLKLILYPIVFLTGAVIIYLSMALVGMLIPVNPPKLSSEKDIEIFVMTNGLHADFVFPSKNEIIDWEELLPLSTATKQEMQYIVMGWGEKNFYLNTPTLSDLTLPVLLKALFIPSKAAMHVEYRRFRPQSEEEHISSIMISEEMYRELVDYVLAYFILENETFKIYPEAGYHQYDDFYAAKGKYHLFWTCNNWTNTGLKKIGIKNSLWTPMDWGVFFYLD